MLKFHPARVRLSLFFLITITILLFVATTFVVVNSNSLKLVWQFKDDRINYNGRIGIAPDETLYVTNYSSILELNKGFSLTKLGNVSVGTVDNYLHAVLPDANGNLLVTNLTYSQINLFNRSTSAVSSWGTDGKREGEFMAPEGLAVDARGYIYVADTGNHRIQKFDSSRQFVTEWGRQGKQIGEFNSPAMLAVDRQENIYVADTDNHRIQKFDRNGRFLTKWGGLGEGPGQFTLPQGIAVDRHGNVYVADTANRRIQKFDSNGHFLALWDGLNGLNGSYYKFGTPGDIAIDAEDNIYIYDWLTPCILKIRDKA